ncbi:MAG: polyhydroxyalkanoate synthesis repressor PhaR [Gammaproteobacteria bacterium]|nr:polyhydroxyalkanoate synthesis repressor PhaR [Gammaproteobacteria bacterium]
MTTRIIKKYPNRRLYDTEESRYITLADLRKLVIQRIGFEVLDSNNGNDLTRSILLQIILEEESGGKPLFTSNMLAELIRLYGGTVQGMFARYLEESLTMFAQQQWQSNPDPMRTMDRMTKGNMKLWMDMQKDFFRSIGIESGVNGDPDK